MWLQFPGSVCSFSKVLLLAGSVVIIVQGEAEFKTHPDTHTHTFTFTSTITHTHTRGNKHQRGGSRTSECTSRDDRRPTMERLTGKALPCIHLLRRGIRNILAPTGRQLLNQDPAGVLLKCIFKSFRSPSHLVSTLTTDLEPFSVTSLFFVLINLILKPQINTGSCWGFFSQVWNKKLRVVHKNSPPGGLAMFRPAPGHVLPPLTLPTISSYSFTGKLNTPAIFNYFFH